MKQLFQLDNNLTISKTPNLMLEQKTDAQLAEEFASYFLQFQHTNEYTPEVNTTVPKLQDFLPLTRKEIEKVTLSMKNKTCELDVILTNLIKDILPTVLNTITQIVNMSLTTGTFPLEWKKAIVRSLIKRLD